MKYHSLYFSALWLLVALLPSYSSAADEYFPEDVVVHGRLYQQFDPFRYAPPEPEKRGYVWPTYTCRFNGTTHVFLNGSINGGYVTWGDAVEYALGYQGPITNERAKRIKVTFHNAGWCAGWDDQKGRPKTPKWIDGKMQPLDEVIIMRDGSSFSVTETK